VTKRVYALFVCVFALVLLGSVWVLDVLGFPPFGRVVAVSELAEHPGSWVGVRVRVKGVIVGAMSFPERHLPYAFGLRDRFSRAVFGLTLPGSFNRYFLYESSVVVVGVVVAGQTSGMFPSIGVFYLRAERIDTVLWSDRAILLN
jgi:hypothetical protein